VATTKRPRYTSCRNPPHSFLDHPVLRHLFANASDLFTVADYRRTWAIGAFCGVARWLEFVAIAIFAYELTHSPELVALLHTYCRHERERPTPGTQLERSRRWHRR